MHERLAVFLLIVSAAAGAQISPGRLSQAHQSLEGATNCTQCHAAGVREREFRCLDCHKEIASRVDAQRGYHAKAALRGNKGTNCARCHSEHNGIEFKLIRWQPTQQQFDHTQSGYPLQGKHLGLGCEKCHNATRVLEKGAIQVRDLNRTFLGLSPACASCHEDKHRGQLGSNCLQCHNHESWKTVSGFDHARTRFALTGAHARVKCADCHGPNAKIGETSQYKGLHFDTCAACHTDPHRGTFTATCQSCHNTEAWKKVRLSGTFDHARTAYPLTGKHESVGCVKCHRSAEFKKPLAHAQCRDCHADQHKGQFAQRTGGGECAACHTTQGFKPSTYTVTNHATAGFPLRAKHINVTCAKCHTGTGPEMKFRLPFARCDNCHKDPHAGDFAAAPYLNGCERCHTEERFLPSTFTLPRHKQSRFPLMGAHAAVICTDCHTPLTPGGAASHFRFADQRCESCHRDPHNGQFGTRMTAKLKSGATSCGVCHSVETWKDLTAFDHAQTKFPLQGSHRAVACAQCHKTQQASLPFREAKFAGTPLNCSGCHQDVHGGQFARGNVAAECSECHESRVWKPSRFDHDTRTQFPLKGGHEGVACARCHTQTRTVSGRSVVIYKSASTKCADCHRAGIPKR